MAVNIRTCADLGPLHSFSLDHIGIVSTALHTRDLGQHYLHSLSCRLRVWRAAHAQTHGWSSHSGLTAARFTEQNGL